MSDVSKRNRQSSGQPTGGQFATEARGTDTGVTLGEEVEIGNLSMADLERMERDGTLTGYAERLRTDFDAFVGENRDTIIAEDRALGVIDTTDFLLRTSEDVPISGLDPNDGRYSAYLRIAHDVVAAHKRGRTRAAIDRLPQFSPGWPASRLPSNSIDAFLPTETGHPATIGHTSHGTYWLDPKGGVMMPVEGLGEYAGSIRSNDIPADGSAVPFRVRDGRVEVTDEANAPLRGDTATWDRILDGASSGRTVEVHDFRPRNGKIKIGPRSVRAESLELVLGTRLADIDSERVNRTFEFAHGDTQFSHVHVTHRASGRVAAIQPMYEESSERGDH